VVLKCPGSGVSAPRIRPPIQVRNVEISLLPRARARAVCLRQTTVFLIHTLTPFALPYVADPLTIETRLTHAGYLGLERQPGRSLIGWSLAMSEQCVYLCTTNDRNGNPRRAYAFWSDDASYREVFFEGYKGFSGVAEQVYPSRRDLMRGALRVNVSVKEWKRLTYQS